MHAHRTMVGAIRERDSMGDRTVAGERAGWSAAAQEELERMGLEKGGDRQPGLEPVAGRAPVPKRAISATEIIVVDKSETALDLARKVGAHYTFIADEQYPAKIMALTGGRGVDVVIDFVGQNSTVAPGFSITRRGGYYYLVGYGGKLSISTLEMVRSQKTIVGILGGSLPELRELITMVDRGLVSLTTREYSLNEANKALWDLKEGRNFGRSVLIP